MARRNNIRRLKIYRKFQDRRYGVVEIPEIRLEGKWLEVFGFKQGKRIKILQEKNKLTITIDTTRKKYQHS